jgi:hypothetical protein
MVSWIGLTVSGLTHYSIHFPTLLKYILRNIDNPMTYWKVIALVSGNIEAVSGLAAQDRPGTHERTI